MRKKDIEKLARSAAKADARREIAQKAAPSPSEREDARGVILDPSSIAALSDAIVAGLRAALVDIGPILARIAAADTIHTVQQLETVLRGAVSEGEQAAAIIKGIKG